MMSLLKIFFISLSIIALSKPQDDECSSQTGAVECLFGDYCRLSSAVCVNGFCQCPNSNVYGTCTCLPSIGPCTIERNAENPAGTPSFDGDAATTIYSCAANTSCNYDVHVLSCYEARNGFLGHPTGYSTVNINVIGQSTRPIVLVLVSYEPIAWSLNIPSGLVIDTVIVIAFYPSSVSYTPGRVLTVERPSRGEIPCGYGTDDGGGDTVGLLQYLVNRFGHVSSFSGTYRADAWTVNMNHQLQEGCGLHTLPPPTSFTEIPTDALTTIQTEAVSIQTEAIACPWAAYCSQTIESGAVCVNGFCQCPDSDVYDTRTCLPSIGPCTIERNAENPAGTPSFDGDAATTIYSCAANTSCNYDVHVLSCYEAINRGFRQHPTGHSTVNINVIGQSTRPIVLVLVSYEPIAWSLNIPSGVVIDTVIVIAYYSSDVSYTPGRVLTVERSSRGEIPRGYGTDDGGGDTVGLLQYLVNRFGHVSSFSGTYRADAWTVNMNRQLQEGCGLHTLPPPTSFTEIPTDALTTIQTEAVSIQTEAIACPWAAYCSQTIESGAVCVNGFCQCPDSDVYDTRTCLPSIGPCTIERNAENPAGTPSFDGDAATTIYSCAANTSCNYDVHVLSCYEARNGFLGHPTGHSTVNINAIGQGTRPIVLVLVSYEPIAWSLNIPSGLVIDTVIVIAYYSSDVSYTPGRVLTVERPSRGEIPRGYGTDDGGGDTVGLLQYLVNRFGHVSSFSGTYRVDVWTVNMNRQLQEGCGLYTLPPPTGFTGFPRFTEIPTDAAVTAQTEAISCSHNSYCSATIETGAVCVNGYCQCPNSKVYDSCTCLPSIASCTIQLNAESPVGIPSYTDGVDETYSCASNANCNYDVHVLSCYEAMDRGFRQHPTGRSAVNINAIGQGTRPIVLVLVSYEPIIWSLNIPSGVVIDTVIVIAYFSSDVSYTPGRVLTVERPSRGEIPRGYGTDDGGGDTMGLLQYLVNRFGHVASFSGTYRADAWTVNMNRQEGCNPSPPTSVTSSCSASSPSSGSTIAWISGFIAAFIGIFIFVISVLGIKRCASKSQASTPARHNAPVSTRAVPYPRQQQGNIYHSPGTLVAHNYTPTSNYSDPAVTSSQPQSIAVQPPLPPGAAAYYPRQPAQVLVSDNRLIPNNSELLMEAPPAYPATQYAFITPNKSHSANAKSVLPHDPPPPYPDTVENT